MKNKFAGYIIFTLLVFSFFSCSEDTNTVETIYNDASIAIGQGNNTVGITVTAANAKAASQTAPMIFTSDSIFASYSVTGYGGGNAYITLINDEEESETFSFDGNQTIGNRPLSFKPSKVQVDIKEGYTGVIAMAVTGK